MPDHPVYPFIPKSTSYIEPGHFWSIPLSGGGYACGRVIQLWVKDGKRDQRGFLAGLMDWSGDEPPTADAIVGRRVVEQGRVHVKTIGENGGEIVGFRGLALDAIEPNLFRDAECATFVQFGLDRLRQFDRALDSDLPVFSTWGFGVIRILAEKHFGRTRQSAV